MALLNPPEVISVERRSEYKGCLQQMEFFSMFDKISNVQLSVVLSNITLISFFKFEKILENVE